VAILSLYSLIFKSSIDAATKMAELPGFYVRIIPTATSLFNGSKMNLSRNNVRAYNKGNLPGLNTINITVISSRVLVI
jgi:hypothetical protein